MKLVICSMKSTMSWGSDGMLLIAKGVMGARELLKSTMILACETAFNNVCHDSKSTELPPYLSVSDPCSIFLQRIFMSRSGGNAPAPANFLSF